MTGKNLNIEQDEFALFDNGPSAVSWQPVENLGRHEIMLDN